VIVAIESHQGAFDMQVTTIGLDIAKNVFQVHGIDAVEKVVVRKQLWRSQVLEFFKALLPCLVGMEACATAHYWARELTKLGHQVRLMPAKDVKAYVNPVAEKQTESVYRIIDVVGVSEKSWEDAGRKAVETAAGSLRDLRVAEVTKMDMKVDNGKVTAFRTRVALSFKYETD
jgi:flavin-binding protein dodecin